MELWKPVPGLAGIYEVSDQGRVRSLDHNSIIPANGPSARCIRAGRVLKPSTDYKGYLRVRLYTPEGPRNVRVHRIVAEAFIPNPDNKPQINHINGVKTDNSVKNLEWVTQSENQRHCFDVLHQTAKGGMTRPVMCVEKGYVFPSISSAARLLDLQATNICKVCSGRLKTTGGYHFKYTEEVKE